MPTASSKMKYFCYIFLAIFIVAMMALILGLFDIVALPDRTEQATGLCAILSLAIFIKLYIRLYKSTRRH